MTSSNLYSGITGESPIYNPWSTGDILLGSWVHPEWHKPYSYRQPWVLVYMDQGLHLTLELNRAYKHSLVGALVSGQTCSVRRRMECYCRLKRELQSE
jgi:hypothetical protein